MNWIQRNYNRCAEIYERDFNEDPTRLRWYHLAIPGGSLLYMDANTDNINLRTGSRAILSMVTNLGLIGIILKGLS